MSLEPASPPSASSPAILPRIGTLDGVRGIAIIMVLFHNLNVLDLPGSAIARSIDTILDRGWIGVQLFFALSGYLITTILLKTRHAPNYFSAFYARRVLRIFPLYYLTLLFFLLILPAASSSVATRISGAGGGIWLWLFLSNWVTSPAGGLDLFPHFWSLAVEEQFYLFWPLLVYVVSPRALLKICLLLIVAALALRTGMRFYGVSHESVYLFSICRMDALAVGAALATARFSIGIRVRTVSRSALPLLALFVTGALITHGYPRTSALGQTIGYAILSICCGLFIHISLIAESSDSILRRALQSRPLTIMGKYSYGIYVLHTPINLLIGLPLIHLYFEGPISSLALSMTYVLLMGAMILAVSMLVYRVIEKPFLDLKRWFKPEAAPAPST